jgi:Zn-dependent protease with chaperone function
MLNLSFVRATIDTMFHWNMNALTSSYWGMYAVQTVLHSVIASVLVDCALLSWGIRTPIVKQRFRFLVIFLPVAAFPVYQMISPVRGDVYYRLESLLDSNKWFFLDLGGIPLFVVFGVLLLLSAIIFIVQEFLPIVFHMLEQLRGTDAPDDEVIDEDLVLKVSQALEGLPFDEEFVDILNDDDLTIFSSTGLNPRIYLSTGLIRSFTAEHLQAAFAHEIGHIQRSRKPVLILAYILRICMFYNPVAMFEFRKLAHEEEEICDDFAVALTGKPEALSEAVDLLRPAPEDYDLSPGPGGMGTLASSIEYHSHNSLMKSRMERISRQSKDDASWGIPFFVTMALVVSINYFIV